MAYDPKSFWNEKARRATEPVAAVCLACPADNEGIDSVQRRLLGRALARLNRAMPLVGKRVLDYGSGIGRFVPLLESMGCVYSGVDIAEEMVALARRQRPLSDFRVLENSRIPHADATFDLVISVAVIHHNPYEQQERILDEIIRVLKPSGHAVLFESIGNPDPTNSLEFSRSIYEWLALCEKRGLLCTHHEGGRYFLTRTAWHRLRGLVAASADPVPAPRWVDALGAVADPIAGRLLPRRYQTRAVMVFERGQRSSSTPTFVAAADASTTPTNRAATTDSPSGV